MKAIFDWKGQSLVLNAVFILVNLFVANKGKQENKEGMENASDSSSTNTKKPSQAQVINNLNSDKRAQDSTPITPPVIEGKTDEHFEVGRPKKTGGYNIDEARQLLPNSYRSTASIRNSYVAPCIR
jgi:hypothetical protein